MADYTVTLKPPAYPERCFPGRCRHEPQFVMQAEARIVRVKRRNEIEIAHSVCLACGLPRPATYGGNVFGDLNMLWEDLGWHAAIGARIIFLRNKWAQIAAHLFNEQGWNGRHERVARLIDPRLTMKLEVITVGGARLAKVSVDREYFRLLDEAA